VRNSKRLHLARNNSFKELHELRTLKVQATANLFNPLIDREPFTNTKFFKPGFLIL
jgi:hypothetical protein